MRAAPAVSIAISRFGLARAALAFVGTAAGAALLAWLVLWMRHAPSWSLAIAVGALCLAVGLAGFRLVPRAACLRWDGERWHLGPAGKADRQTESTCGDIDVAVDLGGWMLLRFRPDAASRAVQRSRWLALQRWGLEHDWHALRCAVYSPRPALRPEPAADT